MKVGVIDVGGGLRGIYAAGVLDYCMDHEITFDLGIGVSAGSANLASFLAHQRGRNYRFYTDYSFRKEYMGMGNFLSKGSFINLDYGYGTLCLEDGENPLDYPALRDNPMEFYVVAANAQTGAARYFDKSDIAQDDYRIFMASSSLPLVCKPYEIDGVPYYDGALADPVPVKKAFDLGCNAVVVILTRPESFQRTPEKDEKIAHLIKKHYPAAAENLCQRAQRYNDSVQLAQEYARQGKAVIIAPDDTCGVDTLTRDKAALKKLYDKGYTDGQKVAHYIQVLAQPR